MAIKKKALPEGKRIAMYWAIQKKQPIPAQILFKMTDDELKAEYKQRKIKTNPLPKTIANDIAI